MKIGIVLGALSGLAGIFGGTYLSLAGIRSALLDDLVTGLETGIAMGLIGATLGVSLAVIGIVANKIARKNDHSNFSLK